MRNLMIFVLAFCLCVSCRDVSHSGNFKLEDLQNLSKRFNFLIVLDDGTNGPVRFVYADVFQHVHAYVVKKNKPTLEWETTNLASRVSALFLGDLYGDGKRELVIATSGGRILFYDADDYDLLWENLQDPFKNISCMTSANLDTDRQQELIFVADSFLYIYDSLNKSLDWKSQKRFVADQILVGNVDDDDQPEIILNTGAIIDSRFYNLDFQVDEGFGDRISLLDVNGDGVPEVIGENKDFTLRIFDVYAQRQVW